MHADIGASRVKETPLSLELLSLNKALCTFFGIQANSSSHDQRCKAPFELSFKVVLYPKSEFLWKRTLRETFTIIL